MAARPFLRFGSFGLLVALSAFALKLPFDAKRCGLADRDRSETRSRARVNGTCLGAARFERLRARAFRIEPRAMRASRP